MSRKIFAGVFALALAFATRAWAGDDGSREDAVRQAFMNAMAAAAVAPASSAAGDDGELREYPLYHYLQAARLRRQLELATPAKGGAR